MSLNHLFMGWDMETTLLRLRTGMRESLKEPSWLEVNIEHWIVWNKPKVQSEEMRERPQRTLVESLFDKRNFWEYNLGRRLP